jgi:hypothetical protein
MQCNATTQIQWVLVLANSLCFTARMLLRWQDWLYLESYLGTDQPFGMLLLADRVSILHGFWTEEE